MPVLSLACHLPHNTPLIPSRYNNEQTTKQTKAISNSYIYIYISHVNVTQTVPDISPLMPMHQDPLLVYWVCECCLLPQPSPYIIPHGVCCLLHQAHWVQWCGGLNSLRPRWNVRHFSDDIFKCVFVNEDIWISISILLQYVRKGRINNTPALVHIMAWRRPGDKPLSGPMMVSLLTHSCVTWPP